jgi:DNA-binding NtrC family response regulator
MRETAASRGNEGPTIKEILEEVIDEMLGAGLLWPEVSSQFEKLYILAALRRSRGSVQGAARLMGVHRNTLSNKVREYGINRAELRRKG